MVYDPGKLAEETRHGQILDNQEMLGYVRALYETALARRREWDPTPEGEYPNSFFHSPLFRFPGRFSPRRTRLMVSPADCLKHPGIITEHPRAHRRGIGRKPVSPNGEYHIKLPPENRPGPYPFFICRAYLQVSYADHIGHEEYRHPELYPEHFISEADTERLVVQGIVGAALERFALPLEPHEL